MINEKKLVIVDDAEINRAILIEAFMDEYPYVEAENGLQAWEIISSSPNDIAAVLLDLVMPVMDGIEVLKRMVDSGLIEQIPVFLVTSETQDETVVKAFKMGVVDIIGKPFTPLFIKKRLGNIIELYYRRRFLQETVRQQTEKIEMQAKELQETNSAIIETLSTAIEFRDSDSGEHVKRIKWLTESLLSEIMESHPEFGLTPSQIQLISEASVMHDVGKIAIPDEILNKPGRFTVEEFEKMKLHTIKGCDILNSVDKLKNSDIYSYAYDICRHHHERWDGKGYPDKLIGNEITIWAQIVAIADVYDALVTERVYKKAYSHEVAVKMIQDGECGQFNPILMECFEKAADDINRKIYQNNNES